MEALRATYEEKFRLLREATEKIRKREPIDIVAELKLANALTQNKYNSVTDVHWDKQLETFLMLADESPDTVEPKPRAEAADYSSTKFL